MASMRLLSIAIGLLMLMQPVAGLLFAEQYRDVAWIRATWLGNDWVTLLVALPLFALGYAHARRGSLRGHLLWFGLLGYAVYNYAFYLIGAALNVFFPLYVLVVGAGHGHAHHRARGCRCQATGRRLPPSTPVRLVGATLVVIGTSLAVVWVVLWAAYIFAARPLPGGPEPFKVVAALDLTIMVPALTIGGFLLWRRRPWGFVLATIAGVQGALYLLVLSVNSMVAIRRGLVASPGELPLWGTLTLVTGAAAVALLANVQPSRRESRPA